ncbi:hypothetical protein BGZ94_010188, partial [Podila epigama]
MRETPLSTTLQYANGSVITTFKPAFYKNPVMAKKTMGSFLHTLASRSWLKSSSLSLPSSSSGRDKRKPGLKPVLPTDAFLGYLPMGGGNNQFTSLQRAALLAKDLNRTLILPPIAPSSHIK